MENNPHICRPALISSARYYGCELLGELRMGRDGRSLSSEVRITHSGARAELTVRFFSIGKAKSHYATGEIAAECLDNIVPKPRLLERVEWQEGPQIWQADLSSPLESAPCSTTPILRSTPPVTPQWYLTLRQSLQRLAAVETDRAAIRTDLIAKRIHEQFRGLSGIEREYQISNWTTAHGYLHWACITAPSFAILSWESWGKAPVGFDAAMLYCHSGLFPEVASNIRSTFPEVFNTPWGLTTTLFACAEVKRRIESDSDYAGIEPWIDTVAFECRSKLSVLG